MMKCVFIRRPPASQSWIVKAEVFLTTQQDTSSHLITRFKSRMKSVDTLVESPSLEVFKRFVDVALRDMV